MSENSSNETRIVSAIKRMLGIKPEVYQNVAEKISFSLPSDLSDNQEDTLSSNIKKRSKDRMAEQKSKDLQELKEKQVALIEKRDFAQASDYLEAISVQVFKKFSHSPEFSDVFGDQANPVTYYYNDYSGVGIMFVDYFAGNSSLARNTLKEEPKSRSHFKLEDLDFSRYSTKSICAVGSKYQKLSLSLEVSSHDNNYYWLSVNVSRADSSCEKPLSNVICTFKVSLKNLELISEKGLNKNKKLMSELTDKLAEFLFENTDLTLQPENWMQVKGNGTNNKTPGDEVKVVTISGLEIKGNFIGSEKLVENKMNGVVADNPNILYDLIETTQITNVYSSEKEGIPMSKLVKRI